MALDFDGGIPFEDVRDRAEHYDLPILLAYDTYRSKAHDRFRVVFLNDASVPDVRVARAMLTALHTAFPEADPQSKSAVQMYYGGKELLHYDESVLKINIGSLFLTWQTVWKTATATITGGTLKSSPGR